LTFFVVDEDEAWSFFAVPLTERSWGRGICDLLTGDIGKSADRLYRAATRLAAAEYE
jgi:hypothetical protein